MKRLITLAAAGLALTACGDQPVPPTGFVTDANYHAEWTQIHPQGPQTCSGTSPRICTPGRPMWIQQHPAEWRLEITSDTDKEWSGTVAVGEDVYNRCNLGERWTDCAQPSAGDTR